MDEGVAVLVIILILLGVGATVYYHHNNGWALPGGTRLVSEYNESGVVVLSQYITPQPGSVWQLVQAPSGLMFVETDSRLVEDIVLGNLTITNGLIIAPHLYNWYVYQDDDVRDYVLYNFNSLVSMPYTLNMTIDMKYNGDLPDGWFTYLDTFNKTNGVAFASRLGIQGWGTSNVELDVYNTTGYKYAVIITTINTGLHHITASLVDGNYTLTIDGSTTSKTNTYSNLMPYAASARITIADTWASGYAASVWYAKVESIVMDPTWYNGSAYFSSDGGVGVPSGDVQRIPASKYWLWNLGTSSDGQVHFKYFPKDTIIEIKDTVSGAVYKYTIDGVANAAGLVEDYTIEPPTNNTVTIIAHVPSERIRFKAPDGFVVRLIDSASGYEEELPVRDGMVTLAAGDKLELVAKAEAQLYMQVTSDDLAYHITIKDNTGKPADAYVWIYDANGNVIDYGVAKDGTYTLKKSPSTPSAIKVKAVYLSDGIYYHGEQTFKLAEEQHITTPPPPSFLSSHAQLVVGLAIAFILAIIAAAIIAAIRG